MNWGTCGLGQIANLVADFGAIALCSKEVMLYYAAMYLVFAVWKTILKVNITEKYKIHIL